MRAKMNFEKWVYNHQAENARFVFESKAKTPEEMEIVLREMEWIDNGYREDLGLLLWVLKELDEREFSLTKSKEAVEKILEFRDSEICKMIMDFCENNTKEKLDAIRNYLKKDNQFGIIVKGNQAEVARNAKGELMYGFNINNHFCVDSIYRYYNFDNCDIEDDLRNEKKSYEEAESSYHFSEKVLKDYCKRYGIGDELLLYIKHKYEGQHYMYYGYDSDYDDFRPYNKVLKMLYGKYWEDKIMKKMRSERRNANEMSNL